jgi:hypothetical protein
MRHPSQDDLVGHALGALPPRELRRVAKHARGCRACAAELRRLGPAVGALAESVEQLEPPDSLRESLMATVHEEAAEARATAPAPRRRGLRGFLLRPAAAVAAAALFAAGAVGYALRDEEESSRTIAAMGTGSADGSLVVESDQAILHAEGMSGLAEGAVYQVWVAEDGEVTPSAAFVPRADGTATAAVPEAAEGATQVVVTREPRPGLREPTGPTVLQVRL